MRRIPLFLSAALAAIAIPTSLPIGGEAQAQSPRRIDQLRVGPHVLTVIEGSSPDAYNARNSRTRGIRIYEKPHSSTFAAVAAQEIFESEYKRRGGFDKRQMEFIGHSIEALVASRYGGFDFARFEAKEAYTLTFYSQFRGMSQAELHAALRAHRPIAERWLSDNSALVRQLVSYRFPR